MKTSAVIAALCCLVVLPPAIAVAAEAGVAIGLPSLLAEMIDREGLARLPAPPYRCLQASSYDRLQARPDDPETWFANKDHGQFLRVEENAGRREWVLMEHDGPGCISHIWIPLHPNKWDQVVRFYLDGAERPAIEAKWNELVSGKAFVKPPLAFVAAGEDDRPDAGDLYLPIPYARGCKITLDSEPFYYIINYRAYGAAAKVESFSMERFEAAAAEIDRVGRVLAESGGVAEGKAVEAEKTLAPGAELPLELPGGPASLRTLTVSVPAEVKPQALRCTVLTMQCDGAQTVWCPIGEFFGCGPRLRPVADFDRTVAADGTLTCRWVMPYREAARVGVVNLGGEPIAVKLAATVGGWTWDDRSMHFHATWRHEYPIRTQPRSDWNYVAVEGRGVYVGDTLSVFSHAGQWYGEGDERVYVDGEAFPSHLGTGTEDYYGYAWGMTTQFSSPFLSMPRRDHAGGDWQGYTTTSRVRALDAIPFDRSLQIDMEIWHWANTQVAYSVGSFWYARPGATSNRPPAAEQAAAALPELPEPRAIAGAVEGEKMKVAASSPGVAAGPQSLAAHGPERFSRGAQLFVRPQKVGDFIEVQLPAGDDGPRRLVLHMLKSWDYAVVRFRVNGEPVDGEHDLYSPTVEPAEPIDLGPVKPDDGSIRLRIEVAGKNPESKPPGTYFGLDCVELRQP